MILKKGSPPRSRNTSAIRDAQDGLCNHVATFAERLRPAVAMGDVPSRDVLRNQQEKQFVLPVAIGLSDMLRRIIMFDRQWNTQ